MPVWKWSQTANSNGAADGTCPWPEGMAPSQVNDSARGTLAAVAMYRDDIAGAIVTGGSSTAYTVASYSVYDTLAHLNGAMIAFTPHATNGATVTLNVDGLGAKPLRPAPSVELQSNALILGTPYVAIYNNSDAVFYLHGMGSNLYGIPLAAGIDFWGATAPSSAFAFPAGQAISRTTYATLFAIMSTTYGAGDGSTTFNLPDKTGRVSAMKEATATRLTTGVGGVDGATMGSANTSQSKTIGQDNLPALGFSVTGTFSGLTSAVNLAISSTTGAPFVSAQGGGGVQAFGNGAPLAGQISVAGSITGSAASGGGGTALPIVQPTIICNYIIRVI